MEELDQYPGEDLRADAAVFVEALRPARYGGGIVKSFEIASECFSGDVVIQQPMIEVALQVVPASKPTEVN